MILAIGMWTGDDSQPSQWKYWAELVTPLETLQELRESPNAREFPNAPLETQLLDLAVLQIRGSLELDPPVFTTKGVYLRQLLSGTYTVQSKGPDSVPLQPPLPVGLRLRDLKTDPLTVNLDMITCFGWYSIHGEYTIHAPDAKVVQSLSGGLIMSQLVLHTAGSGGPTVDHRGDVVGVNSRSDLPTLPAHENYKAYMRMVSELKPEHGLRGDNPREQLAAPMLE